MRSVKVIFVLAAVALIGAMGCLLAYVFVPEKEVSITEESAAMDDTELLDHEAVPEDLEVLAASEVERFKKEYGMEIDPAEMRKQIEIRKEYEEAYGSSYALEEVFLTEEPGNAVEGDPATEEYAEIIERIQKYVEKYNIDESRYASMTAKEELAALEVEYDPLEEEDASASMEGNDAEKLPEILNEPVLETKQEAEAP